jgi:hypothetical protein
MLLAWQVATWKALVQQAAAEDDLGIGGRSSRFPGNHHVKSKWHREDVDLPHISLLRISASPHMLLA